MSTSDYTVKEVISEFRTDIKEHLNRIEIQTTTTNGRVDSLEITRNQLWAVIGVIIFLGGVIVSLAVMALDYKIKNAVESALSQYETE